MVNQQLLDYIKQQTQQGISKEQIKSSLIANGWQAQDIDEAFSLVSNPANQSSPVPPPAQTISSLPGATAIFGQAWTIYKQRLGTFLGVMAIPMLIMVVHLVANQSTWVRSPSPAPELDFPVFDQPFRGRRIAPPSKSSVENQKEGNSL